MRLSSGIYRSMKEKERYRVNTTRSYFPIASALSFWVFLTNKSKEKVYHSLYKYCQDTEATSLSALLKLKPWGGNSTSIPEPFRQPGSKNIPPGEHPPLRKPILPSLQSTRNVDLNPLDLHPSSAEIFPDNMISLFISSHYHNIIVQIYNE